MTLNKIPINIYNMLHYIDSGFYLSEKDRVQLENTTSINSIFARMFEVALHNFNGQGKRYNKVTEVLARPTGIVNISESFRQGTNLRGEYVCTRHVLEDNTDILSVAKATAIVLINDYELEDTSSLIKAVRSISNIPTINKKQALIKSRRIVCRNTNELALLRLCKWILYSESIVLDGDKESTRIEETSKVITVQMHLLFEEFIRSYLQKTYVNVDIDKLTYEASQTNKTEFGKAITDVTIRWHDKTKASIFEMKYYTNVYFQGSIRTSHRFQVHGYMSEEKSKSGYDTTGVLIYGQVWDNDNDIGIFKTFEETGIDMKVSYAIINLNAPFEDIKAMIDKIYLAELSR